MIPATAFILIGGKSKRFGSPKWEAKIQNQTVLDKIWNTCDIFEKRVIVGKEKPNSIFYPFISDELDFDAPINGLYTAIKYSKTEWNLILSCDLPLINQDAIETLWNSRNEKADAVIPAANGQEHGTCGFYCKQILPKVESAIQKKDYSLKLLIEEMNTVKVDFEDDERFWNMNTQKDYAEIEKLVSGKKRNL